MENDKTKKYDIEKLAESNIRERKMNSDFADDDLGTNFFETMKTVLEQMNEMEKKYRKKKN